jgi:hypothetical protein
MFRALRSVRLGVALTALASSLSACASLTDGPTRLYPIEHETQILRDQLAQFNLVEFSNSGEARRKNMRNDFVAARMYAIDIQYTAYEAALTRERQGLGFGAAATTIGLTTASKLVTPVATKDLLTSVAGAVTGVNAAYGDEVLLSHGMQWIQSQMRAQRARVAERMLLGMRMSTSDYPLAAVLSDLEEYYRAGTFTGGLLSTSETVAADAKLSEQLKAARIEFSFVATPAGQALTACAVRPGAKARLLRLVPTSPGVSPEVTLVLLQTGQSPGVAQDVLARARNLGICP